MTDIKLCKDCKWYKKDWFEHLTGGGDRFDTCYNPVLSENEDGFKWNEDGGSL